MLSLHRSPLHSRCIQALKLDKDLCRFRAAEPRMVDLWETETLMQTSVSEMSEIQQERKRLRVPAVVRCQKCHAPVFIYREGDVSACGTVFRQKTSKEM